MSDTESQKGELPKTQRQDSITSLADIISKFDEKVQEETTPGPPPRPNLYLLAAQKALKYLMWHSFIFMNIYWIIGSILLVVIQYNLSVVSRICLSLCIASDVVVILRIFVRLTTDNESNLTLVKTFLFLILAIGRQDLRHLSDHLRQHLQSDVLDILTMLNTQLSIPFLVLIISDGRCVADFLCHWFAISILGAASLISLKSLTLLVFY
ncbi:3461_t:CDS:2 [Ambispora leptoticha]|uniref:3461_t:CDS:1 n=1 Tax=Ambispora leptoticha TaxID=144679 RepID=A0A9N9AYJ7_9GLOM|nr:3461_t:CDS:2 [Ambispora leptoticha]